MMTGKAPQLVAPQRMPTGAPLPPAAPSRAAAPSRPTARPSAAAPARPAGPTVAPGAAQDSAAPAGKPSQAAAVFRAPAPSAARPQPLVTPSAAALLAGAAEGPPQEAAPAGHGGAHGQAAGAAQPKALAPLRAPRTPPLRRGSSHGEAPGDTAHKAPRTEATPHCAQDGPRDGGYPLSGCGGSSSSTAGPRQLQLALPPPARPWETQVAWDTSAGAFGTAWGTHGAVGPGGAAAAPLAGPAPADASSQALVPFNAAWQQQPPGAAPPAELHPRAQPLLGGFGGLPPGPLDPLVWLGEDGGWAPGRAPGADLQAPRYISQGTCNPPGPCREGCRCNQVASNPRDLEKPWLEDKAGPGQGMIHPWSRAPPLPAPQSSPQPPPFQVCTTSVTTRRR
ncbi:unnamed protein product [Prorocentrum cordatum]|uniref:Uncharacterized protein n=1 Tax=Prorocentrum cordatum TaxID=2364126 RepID=A0ABN9UCH1_9DINO|nr:unnamed protein product [Polarella glacialis]